MLEALGADGRAGTAAARRGIAWLRRNQRPDGSWPGWWACYHLHGTSAAVTGLTAAILGGTTAIGAGVVGILYAGITVGAVNGLQIMLGVPREIGSTVLALMIVLVAIQAPLQKRIERARERRRTNRRLDAGTRPSTEQAEVHA